MSTIGTMKKHLKDNGFDGLYDGGECGCLLEDLMPCEEPRASCSPGYKGPCGCGDHDYHVGPEKEDKDEN